MNRKISKMQFINLMLLLSTLNGNMLSMQKSDIERATIVRQERNTPDELNKRLRNILNRIPVNKNVLKKAVKLILAGANVNEKDDDEYTALAFAAMNGYKDLVQLLIDSGANVNEKDNCGFTALMWAAYSGHEDIVQLLIYDGANINEKDNRGYTALDIATSNGHKGTVQLLKAAKNKENQNN